MFYLAEIFTYESWTPVLTGGAIFGFCFITAIATDIWFNKVSEKKAMPRLKYRVLLNPSRFKADAKDCHPN